MARKASRSLLQEALFRRPRGDSFDLLDVAYFSAAVESARFYEEFMLTAAAFETDLLLLTHAMSIAPTDGLILEFGVASGRTIRHIGALTDRSIHGFDSFKGLPESWRASAARRTHPRLTAPRLVHRYLAALYAADGRIHCAFACGLRFVFVYRVRARDACRQVPHGFSDRI